jgi:hypothetical protein
MVTIPYKERITNLDERYWWQVLSPLPGCGNAQPARRSAILQRVEIAVKVVAAAFTAADQVDGYGPQTGIAAGRHFAFVCNACQVK